MVPLGKYRLLAAEIVARQLRIEAATLMFSIPTPASCCAPDPIR
jgi:hypothetical protein